MDPLLDPSNRPPDSALPVFSSLLADPNPNALVSDLFVFSYIQIWILINGFSYCDFLVICLSVLIANFEF